MGMGAEVMLKTKWIRTAAQWVWCVLCLPSVHAGSLALDLMPDKGKTLADVAVLVAKQQGISTLDFSPESLKAVDQLVLKFRAEGNMAQSIQKTFIVLGGYVGEVMVRNLGLKWDNPNEAEQSVGFNLTGIRAKDGGLSNPIGKVFKLMQNGEEDSLAHFYAVFSNGTRQRLMDMIDKTGQ